MIRYLVGGLTPRVKHIQYTSARHKLRPDAIHCAVRAGWHGVLIDETSPFFSLPTCRACLKSWDRYPQDRAEDQQSDYLLAGEWRRV